MIFGFIRKFSGNTLARGAANFIANNPKSIGEMAQYIENAVFTKLWLETETADEMCVSLHAGLINMAQVSPNNVIDWRQSMIDWQDQYRKDGNKCGMYAYNLVAAAYSSALDAAKLKKGANERCYKFCEVITISIMSKRNIEKLTGSADVEASRDHTDAFQGAKDPDEYVPNVVECPKCSTELQVTSDKSGTIRCPKCSNAFEAKT